MHCKAVGWRGGHNGIVRARDKALCEGAKAMKGAGRAAAERGMEGHGGAWAGGGGGAWAGRGGRAPRRSLVVLGIDK